VLEWCDDCLTYHTRPNSCFPPYRCAFAEEGACGPATIRASDIAEAAERFVEMADDNSGETTDARCKARIVIVRDERGRAERWCVRGEVVMQYHAEPIGEEDGDDE
jgi:hypothetical protein